MDPLIKELRARSKDLAPSIRIGKLGVTPGVIGEINKLLDLFELVKIKMLKTSLDETKSVDAIADIVERTNSTLVARIGLTFTLYRKSEKAKHPKSSHPFTKENY